MPRPKIPRSINFQPNTYYFKPRGIPLRELEEIELQADEVEAIKLYEIEGLEQKQAAVKMGISQPTFARLLAKANKKIAQAIIYAKAIKIAKEDI